MANNTLGEIIIGPIGAQLSKPFEKHHWGTLPAKAGSRCQVRAETSFAAAYPATYSRASSGNMFFPSFPIIIAYDGCERFVIPIIANDLTTY